MSPDGFVSIYHLHHNRWDEYLLSNEFRYIRNKILTRQENRIVHFKVGGMPDEEIIKLLGIAKSTFIRYTYSIREKYRTGTRRIDNNIILRKMKQIRGGK